MVSPAVYSLRTTSADGISVGVDDKKIVVSGVADADKEVTIILFDENGSIAYVDQTTSNEEGIFEFNFMVNEYGTYTMKLGNVASSAIEQTITVDKNAVEETITDTTVKVPEEIDTKTNIVRLWIKPKYKAESISFYVTAVCGGTKKQLKILGDKDNDGVFKVPDELALGKWQQITLDLLKLEEVPDSTVVKDFYISANEGSEWVIDSVESEYREINGNEVDFEQFAKDNIIYNNENELSFEILESNVYSNSSKILTGYADISEKISAISVNAEFEKLAESSNELSTTNNKITKYSIPGFTSGTWSGNYKKIFYKNSNDNNYIYCFDTTNYTSTKVLETSSSIDKVSYTGNKIMTYDGVYDLETKEYVPLYGNADHFLSPNGDVFAIITGPGPNYDRLGYKYSNGTYTLFYEEEWYLKQSYLMAFTPFNSRFVIATDNDWSIY